MRAFDGGLDNEKRLDACAKENVLEDHVLQKSRWREFIMHLKTSHTTVWHVLKRWLHMKPCKLSLVQALTYDDKEM